LAGHVAVPVYWRVNGGAAQLVSWWSDIAPITTTDGDVAAPVAENSRGAAPQYIAN